MTPRSTISLRSVTWTMSTSRPSWFAISLIKSATLWHFAHPLPKTSTFIAIISFPLSTGLLNPTNRTCSYRMYPLVTAKYICIALNNCVFAGCIHASGSRILALRTSGRVVQLTQPALRTSCRLQSPLQLRAKCTSQFSWGRAHCLSQAYLGDSKPVLQEAKQEQVPGPSLRPSAPV